MNSSQEALDPSACPLCGKPNGCQRCTSAAYKGPCWCERMHIPDALLAQVPGELRNQACLCRACVMNYHRAKNQNAVPEGMLPGDFYFAGGLIVFTAVYHLRRGYCCGSGCRHCPY